MELKRGDYVAIHAASAPSLQKETFIVSRPQWLNFSFSIAVNKANENIRKE